MRQFYKTYIIIVLIGCFGLNAQAQSLAQAKKLYSDGDFTTALPAFKRLIRQSPNNSFYNLWYGVCLYETGERQDSEKYLAKAMRRHVMTSYEYMGKIYYDTFRFEKAIQTYEEYIDLLKKKKRDTAPWEAALSKTKDALRMMRNVEDIQLIDSMILPKNKFLEAYALSEECGTLESYQKHFNPKNNVESSVYTNQKENKIYYAHPTAIRKEKESVFQLYSQSRLFDSWEKEHRLPDDINEEDTNYPFMMNDGVTLYFASKGHESLGGYDLFVTRYNIDRDKYLKPEQLGMPFNSPANDYMMVIDQNKELGWFVTDRFQPKDTVCVYLFIPDSKQSRLESEDLNYARARAKISSIKDSWREGQNYRDLIALSHKEIPFGKKEIKNDFTFIVEDDLIYYHLRDFKDTTSRTYYEKVIAITKQLEEKQEKLDALREQYSKGTKNVKQRITPTIRQLEKEVEVLQKEPEQWEKKARNAEIRHLLKTNKPLS